MTSKKGLAAMASAVTLTIGLAVSGPVAAQDVKEIRIANTIDVLDESQNYMLGTMLRRIEEINAEGKYKITMDVYDAQSNVDKQLSDVQTALIKNPDILIFSAVDSVGSLPAAQAAHDAGVKIIDRRPVDPEPEIFDVAFHSHDEANYVKTMQNWIRMYLSTHPEATLKVGLIYGNPAQTPQLPRIDGVKELAAEMPDRIQIVAEGYGNWQVDTAQNLTQDWMVSNPDINFIVSANDQMVLGISNALTGAGRINDVMTAGYDHLPDAIARVKAGTQTLSIGANLADQFKNIDVAVEVFEGTFEGRDFYISPIYATDASNVDWYLAKNPSE